MTLTVCLFSFKVQSYASEKSLEELQTTMNAFYNDKTQHYKEPLTSEHLSKDSFFAGQHADGVWYRVKVNSMLDESTAAVKMVDFGDFAMIAVERMQPLWPPFRNLPMQAINASLAGIFVEPLSIERHSLTFNLPQTSWPPMAIGRPTTRFGSRSAWWASNLCPKSRTSQLTSRAWSTPPTSSPCPSSTRPTRTKTPWWTKNSSIKEEPFTCAYSQITCPVRSFPPPNSLKPL